MNINDYDIGDVVVQQINNYNLKPEPIFNGELGYVNGKYNDQLFVKFFNGQYTLYNQKDLRGLKILQKKNYSCLRYTSKN